MDVGAAITDGLLGACAAAAAVACARRGDRAGRLSATGLAIVALASIVGIARFLDAPGVEPAHRALVKGASFLGVPLLLVAWILPPRRRLAAFVVGVIGIAAATALVPGAGSWLGLSRAAWFHVAFLGPIALLGFGRARP